MRVVAALGGNALLRRGEVPLADVQEKHVRSAVEALLPVARAHELVVTHGNGPQVGLLAVESANDPGLPRPYPFDAIGAQTQGLIGYFLLQALENALPDRRVVSLVGQTLVDPADPAFELPTKFVGPTYSEEEARRWADELGWAVRPDGAAWRRVVPSPEPRQLLELPAVRTLVDAGMLVVCSGGGGIPVVRGDHGVLHGVEAVIDKDLAAALLARELGADRLLLLTDVAAVERDFGSDHPAPIGRTSPDQLRSLRLPAGSMGPKVEAACRFVEWTGNRAVIGHLERAGPLLDGEEGTVVDPA